MIINMNNTFNNKTIAQKFDEDGGEFIKTNKLWRKPLIPLHPLNNNYRIITNTIYDIELLKRDLNIAINSIDKWTKKDKDETWQSITLKSFDGNEQSFLKETKLCIGDQNLYKYTTAMNKCNYFKKILEEIPTDIYLVRILKLKSKGRIKFHTDEVVFKQTKDIIRCHLPIITHPNIKFQIGFPLNKPAEGFEIWNASVLHEKYLAPGKLWYTNVNTLHGVENNSNIDRYHLVIDMRPPY